MIMGRASCSRLRTPARDSKNLGPIRKRIGDRSAEEIMEKVKLPLDRRVAQLSDAEVLQIREVIDRDYVVEGDLRRETGINIKRLLDLGCYPGLPHGRR